MKRMTWGKKLGLCTVTAALLALATAVTGLAADVRYAAKAKVKAYEETDKNSEVLDEFEGGDKILIEKKDGDWYATLVEAKDGDGQQLGWIDGDDLSETMPQSFCKHDFGEWKVVQEASCQGYGLEMRYCSVCGTAEERQGGLGDHKYSDWTVTKEATCQADGEKTRTCSVCGDTQTEVIPKGEHKYGSWTVTKEATCQAEGERTRQCKICGDRQTETVPKGAHKYGAFKETKKATCTSEGSKEHTCTVCNHKETVKIEKLPHDFEWKITKEATDHSAGVRRQICKACKEKGKKEKFDPEGTMRVGDRGEEVYRMQQLLADQNYLNANGVDGIFGGGTEKALMAFQTEHGFEADGVCWPQTLKKLDHDFGPWKTIRELTRDGAGERERTCKECGFVQHEILEPVPSIASGSRGEDVRAVQQILFALGYDAGTFDGIYGQKLDAAYAAFAADHEVEFEAGRLYPVHIDALISAWIGSFSEEEMKVSGTTDPVNLALTITPVNNEVIEESDDLIALNWSVTNLGKEACQFNLLLLQFGEEADFRSEDLVLVIDGVTLQPNCANSANGTIHVSRSWGRGNLNFTAMAVSEPSAQKWLSNALVIENEEPAEETEMETEVETEAETEPAA